MRMMENKDGILSLQPTRESTRRIRRAGRSGAQQYLDRGFGKIKNTDYEPLHYQDV